MDALLKLFLKFVVLILAIGGAMVGNIQGRLPLCCPIPTVCQPRTCEHPPCCRPSPPPADLKP